jgi:hypothetical protein
MSEYIYRYSHISNIPLFEGMGPQHKMAPSGCGDHL